MNTLGHVWHTCNNTECPICQGGLQLCTLCNKAEGELDPLESCVMGDGAFTSKLPYGDAIGGPCPDCPDFHEGCSRRGCCAIKHPPQCTESYHGWVCCKNAGHAGPHIAGMNNEIVFEVIRRLV